MKGAWEVIFAGFFLIVALLLLPRLLNSISAQNAALNAQYSPGAAWNRTQAGLINSAGNIGVSLLNNFAESHDATQPNY